MEHTLIINRQFEDISISFDFNSTDTLVDMKPAFKYFNKRIDDFKNVKEIKAFINSLGKSQRFIDWVQKTNRHQRLVKDKLHNLSYNELYNLMVDAKNAPGQPIYVYRTLAIRMAMWLNSTFGVWITETIEDILFGNNMSKYFDFRHNYANAEYASKSASIQIHEREDNLGITRLKDEMKDFEDEIERLNYTIEESMKHFFKKDPNQTQLFSKFETEQSKVDRLEIKLDSAKEKRIEKFDKIEELKKDEHLKSLYKKQLIAKNEMARLKKGVTLHYIK